jgi:hypothetical protein
MAPRFKRFGNVLMNCIERLGNVLMYCMAVAWMGHQALYGEGMLRGVSIFFLIIGIVLAAGAVLDHVRPHPKRRRARERDVEANDSPTAREPAKAQGELGDAGGPRTL